MLAPLKTMEEMVALVRRGLNKMIERDDYIKEIEFFTTYPNINGGRVLLATFVSTEGYRGLLYAPNVSKIELSLEPEHNFEEFVDARRIPLFHLQKMKNVKIDGVAYASHDKYHECEDWFFKTFYLDGPNSKPHIDKKEVEKLFGCKING